ncbi:MAG: tRNA (guanosine(37)-N1)-methyltransferase TrmD [Lachnospiraceae bacterium]|nr:tRNA (guanosine(37)-N1)-methyltransferase TrmD [Lachnospiraceae bacterium]
MKFHVLTLFPEMVEQGLRQSILGRAAEKGQLSFHMVNIRDFTLDKHGKVDDYPYGGGAGMLMQAQPVYDAYLSVTEGIGTQKVRTIYVTPQGRTFTQKLAREFSREKELIFLCGHYEGIDERVLEEIVTDYISLGDYVLTGGELAAMVMIDAIARLVPGVLHNGESAETESFHNHLLEYPQYSRPEVWHDKPVPQVLLSGNHRKIEAWRLEQSLERTRQRRPDLFALYRTQQDTIIKLARNKRKHIHLMEWMARGMACMVCCQGENLMVNVEQTRIYGLYVESSREAGRLAREYMSYGISGQAQIDLVVCQEAAKDLLTEQYGFVVEETCCQACYTRRESLRVEHQNIRPLGENDLEYVSIHYKKCDKTYIHQRIISGAMYGVYVLDGEQNRLAGFIGTHRDGSMGMLYVDEAYRRQGLAASLESWLINRHLKRGETPYCQINENNISAIRLQEKLGLYLCNESMWWLRKGI